MHRREALPPFNAETVIGKTSDTPNQPHKPKASMYNSKLRRASQAYMASKRMAALAGALLKGGREQAGPLRCLLLLVSGHKVRLYVI